MTFKELEAACRQASLSIREARISGQEFSTVLDRVERARDGLEGLERRLADGEIAMLRVVWDMAHDPAFHSSDSMWQAQQAMNRAFEATGDVHERLSRAQAALDELDRIAESALNPSERPAIHRMTHPVVELISRLAGELARAHEG